MKGDCLECDNSWGIHVVKTEIFHFKEYLIHLINTEEAGFPFGYSCTDGINVKIVVSLLRKLSTAGM